MVKKWGRSIKEYFFNPCPTLFDLCVCFGVVGISFVVQALRGLYLEFYAIFLMVIGFNQKQKRNFKGSNLTLLCLLAMISLLMHSLPGHINIRNPSFQYLNFYLMHEGFAYIFFACLLFYIVATKATNLRLLVFTLPVVAKVWYSEIMYCGQMTPLLAVGLGFFVFLLYKRKFKWAIFVALVAIDIMVWNRAWIILKFRCRPYVWLELCKYIRNPPYIGSFFIEKIRNCPLSFMVGSGFNKLVVPDNMIAVSTYGNYWLFKHNDYLSLMAYIGVFAIIPVALFIKELFVRFKRTWFIAPLVAYCALCFFQITFSEPDRVAIILLSMAWCWIEAKKEDVCEKELSFA